MNLPEPRSTEAPLPKFVQIEPVGECNLRCTMCPIQFRRDGAPYGPPAFIDYDAFTGLLGQFSDCSELQLQGLGEPMMHPRFFDMVEYAVARGITVSTNSNLTLLTPRLAQRCVDSGLSRIHVSIDGATAPTYEGIRIRANFEKVLRNLRRLMFALRNAPESRLEVHVVFVVMRRNLHELAGAVEMAARLGVRRMEVQHLCHDFAESSLPEHYAPMREFVQHETLAGEDEARVAEHFQAAREAAQEHGMTLRLPSMAQRAKNSRKPGCSWPWEGAYFSYAGDAMPCCMVSTPDRANLGNAVSEGVEQIWNGERYREFREALLSDTPPEICRSCSVYRGTF